MARDFRRTGGSLTAAMAALLFIPVSSVCATVITGTMSNFDVFNETGQNVYGAEIDIEGCHPTDIVKTFPAHFANMTMTDTGTGTRIVFSGYNFTSNGYITSTVGVSTNGHYCVNLPGCEHFGFSVRAQPTSSRFYWLNQSLQPVTSPSTLSIPNPTWTYVPPAGPGQQAVMQAVIAPPPPVQFVYPDAQWVKVFYIELDRPVDLEELISGPGTVAPQLSSEVEAEWVLLGGDVVLSLETSIADTTEAVLRRYEYYKYTGGYDEVHLPQSSYIGTGEPPANELGQFISSNMVAANLVDVPEPGSLGLVLIGLCGSLVSYRSRYGGPG